MAKSTFSNEQLVTSWAAAAKANGTRRDVVLAILAFLGTEDNEVNYRKAYNNVTQRVKQLEKAGVKFSTLVEGKKGARRSVAEIANLQAILGTPKVEANTDADEKAPADESAGF